MEVLGMQGAGFDPGGSGAYRPGMSGGPNYPIPTEAVRLSVDDARGLGERALARIGFAEDEARRYHQPRGFGADAARRSRDQSILQKRQFITVLPGPSGYDHGVSAAAFRGVACRHGRCGGRASAGSARHRPGCRLR